MDKPDSMSLREWLIKKVSAALIIPERVTQDVITHQFDEAYNALDENNSVEIYEFGKFVFNVKKARKEIEKWKSQKEMYENMMNDESLPEEKRKKAELKRQTAINNIEGLKHEII
jgi:nucleoid DNA-binding protein